MEEEIDRETEVMICDCHSMEHQAKFWHSKEIYGNGVVDELGISIHLTTHRNFFKRLWVGLRYAFGRSSNYGEWDYFIFKDKDVKVLKEFLEVYE